jgi:hypothetical protein
MPMVRNSLTRTSLAAKTISPQDSVQTYNDGQQDSKDRKIEFVKTSPITL